MDKTLSLINKINRKPKDIYNILSFPTHEGYQTLLDKTGHNFYLLDRGGKFKQWDSRYRKLPENTKIIDNCYDDLEIDFILSNERFGQLQFALDFSMHYRTPVIHLEHIEPQMDRWTKDEFNKLKMLNGDIDVFITEHNKGSWNSENGIVVPHGIDMELFSGWEYPSKNNKLYVLYIVNQLEARDYFCGYTEWTKVREKVESQYPDIEFVLVGDNPGLSSPISNEKELSNIIKNCLCYINTTRLSPLPMSLLEAMSCGCPVVSTANQQVPQLINGENGISTNDLDVMASSIIKIYKDRLWAESLGKNARKTIKEKYSLSKFISSWNKIFKQAYDLNLGTGEIGI